MTLWGGGGPAQVGWSKGPYLSLGTTFYSTENVVRYDMLVLIPKKRSCIDPFLEQIQKSSIESFVHITEEFPSLC